MAPTICLPELSMQQKTAPNSYTRCRQRSTAALNNGITKEHERRFGAAKRLMSNKTENPVLDSFSPPASPIWEPSFPKSSPRLTDHWRSILARREGIKTIIYHGLLDIVARTMVLVRRNQMLQKRVNALRSETRDFIRSVLSNPENNGKQERAEAREQRSGCPEQTVQVVSSSSEAFFSGLTPPPTPDSSTEHEMLQGEEDESDYCDIDDAQSFSYPVDSPLSMASLDSDPGSDYSYDYPDSPSCGVTQDPKVSSS